MKGEIDNQDKTQEELEKLREEEIRIYSDFSREEIIDLADNKINEDLRVKKLDEIAKRIKEIETSATSLTSKWHPKTQKITRSTGETFLYMGGPKDDLIKISPEEQEKLDKKTKPFEKKFYKLLEKLSRDDLIVKYYGIALKRTKPDNRISKLKKTAEEIIKLKPYWPTEIFFDNFRDRDVRTKILFLVEIFEVLDGKQQKPSQLYPIAKIDRIAAQDFLPMLMNKGIFSGYTTLPTSEEIINKEKKRLNKEDLTFEEKRAVLAQAKEYKNRNYVIRDYGSYAIGFASQLYIDRIEQTENELNDELRKTLLTPYLFDDMNKNIEEALKRIKLYKLAHRLAYIILSEGYEQKTWEGLVIPKIKLVEILDYSTTDKQIYQDIKEALYSLLWVHYQFWNYEYTDKRKHKKEKSKAIGNFIYNLNEDSKNYTFDINKTFVGCVGELINDKLPRTKKERQEAFNRGYFDFPIIVIPLTRDYTTPAWLLTEFLVRETGNKELNKDGFKIIAYKIEKYIKEANIQHLRPNRRYRDFIQALEQVEIIHKTKPTIEKLKELSPTAGIKTMLYIWILRSPKALDQDMKNILISKKK